MKTKKIILLNLMTFFIFFQSIKVVNADSANFSVTPTIGKNQTGQDLGYFNLLLQPNQSQNLQFTLYNNSNKSIKVETTFGTAFTSQSGNVGYTPDLVTPDPSLKINLKDYVKLPKTVTVPAKSTAQVNATVTIACFRKSWTRPGKWKKCHYGKPCKRGASLSHADEHRCCRY